MLKDEQFISYLKELFPVAECELHFSNTFELLIAVMLSAQCTDKRVNTVTKELFKKYKSPQDFVDAPLEQIEQDIKTCGLYHSKAKNIKSACQSLINNYGGQVPSEYDELLKLAGVGRKTANVVSSIAFNANCIAVDTHVLRVSGRLGYSKSNNPNICEKDLTKRFKNNLRDLHYRMVLFGRYYCKAKNPLCDTCSIKDECLYAKAKSRVNKK